MVGLAPVKQQIRELAAAAEIDADRAQKGLPVDNKTMHLIFTGASGTGKTTVAREIGQMYYHLGLVDKDPSTDEGWVETARSGLVAEYQGQTARNVQRLFEGDPEAGVEGHAGGVIFIDEAYDLYHGDQDQYGKEAITELLRQSENHRDNTVVIMAGYGPDMERLFQSNSGLRRRFPTTLEFPELSLDDRYKVMQTRMREAKLTIGTKAEAEDVREAMVDALRYTGAGNGGDVRNLFGKITTAQKMRLVKLKAKKGDLSVHDLSRITVDDVRAGAKTYAETSRAEDALIHRLVPTGRKKATKKPRKGRLELVS